MQQSWMITFGHLQLDHRYRVNHSLDLCLDVMHIILLHIVVSATNSCLDSFKEYSKKGLYGLCFCIVKNLYTEI